MKRILNSILSVLLLAGSCFAASTGTIELSVTVAPFAEIEVWYQSPGIQSYDFGTLPVSSSVITEASITVKNSSDGLVEDWYIRASDAYGVSQNWSLSSSPGVGAFELRAILNGNVKPSDSDFDVSADDLTNTNQAMTSTNFAGNETGEAVNPGETRGLWFRITTPTEVSETSQHTIWVTIVAAEAG